MGNILTLTPSLTLTQAEMDQALRILEDSLDEVSPPSR
jgi:4-aminobutyrate aminotransferase-like enzyme